MVEISKINLQEQIRDISYPNQEYYKNEFAYLLEFQNFLRIKINQYEKLLNRANCPYCLSKISILQNEELLPLRKKLKEITEVIVKINQETRNTNIENARQEDLRRKEFLKKYQSDLISAKKKKYIPKSLLSLSEEKKKFWDHQMEIMIDPIEPEDFPDVFFDRHL